MAAALCSPLPLLPLLSPPFGAGGRGRHRATQSRPGGVALRQAPMKARVPCVSASDDLTTFKRWKGARGIILKCSRALPPDRKAQKVGRPLPHLSLNLLRVLKTHLRLLLCHTSFRQISAAGIIYEGFEVHIEYSIPNQAQRYRILCQVSVSGMELYVLTNILPAYYIIVKNEMFLT